MAGGPEAGSLDDARMAESLRLGDANALIEIYDYYAPGLYEYCHALLRDRTEAANALIDSLLAAAAHAERLDEPQRLRGWLYALARNACMRRRDDPERVEHREGPHEVEIDEDAGLGTEERSRREEQRLIAHSALARLTGRQREAIDLSVRHELDAADLAGILGMTPDEAGALLGKARGDLGEAIGAALVARTWWDDCPSVAALVDTWPLHPESSRKLVRHVATCPTCGERNTPRVSASRLLDALPVAPLPPDLRSQLVSAAIEAGWEEHRQAVALEAEPFDERGWPVPLATQAMLAERPARRRRAPLVLAGLAGAVVLTLLAAGAMALSGSDGDTSTAKGPSGTASSDSSTPGQPQPTDSSSSPKPTTSSASPAESPSPNLANGASPSRPVSATVAPPPPQSDDPGRSDRRSSSAGRLAVGGCDMSGGDRSCVVSVQAVGGPVTWRVTGTSGGVRAAGGGRLEAGQTDGVQVSRDRPCFIGGSGSVSFSPGGTASVSWDC